MSSLYRTFATLSLVALALSGCAGGKSSSSTGTSATMAPTTEGQRETAALPTRAMAPIPAGLHCGATKPAQGYHPAGAAHHHKRSATSGSMGAPETAPT
jgi:hypothetical protein